jgi:hypothetical protein
MSDWRSPAAEPAERLGEAALGADPNGTLRPGLSGGMLVPGRGAGMLHGAATGVSVLLIVLGRNLLRRK